MFFHNINPVFFSVGPVQIRYYGLVYFLGFLFLYFYARYLIRKKKLKILDEQKLDSFMLYLIIGVLLGARILDFVFYNPLTLFNNPLELFKIWNGGMSYHGGVIGAMVSIFFFSRKYKIRFYALADLVTLPAIFFLAVGRLANYINGELWGTISNSSFCVDYTKSQYVINPPEGCRHPYQLYECAKNLLLFFFLLMIKLKLKLKEGVLFLWFLFLYNSFRFFLDFFRDEQRYLGISTGQYLCLAFVIVSGYFIIRDWLRK